MLEFGSGDLRLYSENYASNTVVKAALILALRRSWADIPFEMVGPVCYPVAHRMSHRPLETHSSRGRERDGRQPRDDGVTEARRKGDETAPSVLSRLVGKPTEPGRSASAASASAPFSARELRDLLCPAISTRLA